jgi:hypothetical protein
MFKLLLCALLASAASYAKDKPATIFGAPLGAGHSENNYGKAIAALLADNFDVALQWYEAMASQHQAKFLGELFIIKTPDKCSDALRKQLADKVKKLRGEVQIPESWKYALGIKELQPIAAASDVKSQHAAARAATAVGVVASSLEVTEKESAAETIQLEGSDGEKISISKTLATNRFKLNLIATALDGEPDAKEVCVPRVSTATLNLLISLLDGLGDVTKAYKDLTLGQKRIVIGRVVDVVQRVSPHMSLDDMWHVISAANYIESPDLYHGLIWVATSKFKAVVDDLKRLDKVAEDNSWKEIRQKFADLQLNGRVFLSELATDYFLQFDEDIDRLLDIKKASIPFETLKAYEKFPKQLLDAFPNLGKDPNEIASGTLPQSALTAMISEGAQNIKVVRALLRLPDIQVNLVFGDGYRSALQSTMDFSDIQFDLLQALIESGVNVNQTIRQERVHPVNTYSYWTLLTFAVHKDNQKLVRMLIAAKADVNKALADGSVPLHYAFPMIRSAPEHVQVAIAEMLCVAGAQVNAARNDGNTALDFVNFMHVESKSGIACKEKLRSMLRAKGALTGHELQEASAKKALAS